PWSVSESTATRPEFDPMSMTASGGVATRPDCGGVPPPRASAPRKKRARRHPCHRARTAPPRSVTPDRRHWGGDERSVLRPPPPRPDVDQSPVLTEALPPLALALPPEPPAPPLAVPPLAPLPASPALPQAVLPVEPVSEAPLLLLMLEPPDFW